MFKQFLNPKVTPGLYICSDTGKGIFVMEDLTYRIGKIKVK
ncbi:unnamed protein product, partial [marine sediment metagenome]